MDGIFPVDKPRGMTSHDVVDAVRRLAGQREVGHAGTLDPLATGVLVLLLGKALRLAEFMEGHDKEYEAGIRLGATTDTDDAEGRILLERPVTAGREEVESAVAAFTGEIEQVPPAYSAVKSGGEPLYRKARRGETVEAKPRRVRIDECAILSLERESLRLRIRCGKGTYIRSIARDLGERLHCGGHVVSLRRLASGPFRLEDCLPMQSPLELLPMEVGLMSWPELRLQTDDARRFEHGRAVEVRPPGAMVRVYCGPRFLGVGERAGETLKPRKVIVTSGE